MHLIIQPNHHQKSNQANMASCRKNTKITNWKIHWKNWIKHPQEWWWELLKCVLSLWYPIKGLMTSKGPGHFLSVLPGAQTTVCWTWTLPAALHSAWPQPDCSLGSGPLRSPRGKSQRLGALRQNKPSGPGSDLICAGQENPAGLVIPLVHEESAPSPTRALWLWSQQPDKPSTQQPKDKVCWGNAWIDVWACNHDWECVTNRACGYVCMCTRAFLYLFVCAAEGTCTSCLADTAGTPSAKNILSIFQVSLAGYFCWSMMTGREAVWSFHCTKKEKHLLCRVLCTTSCGFFQKPRYDPRHVRDAPMGVDNIHRYSAYIHHGVMETTKK